MNDTKTVDVKEKADWLLALEQQSWQAELLVSGIAIFGTLKLPTLIPEIINLMLAWLPNDMMGWLPYYIVFYLALASTGLIVSFLCHFILRSFWIGMVGLNSVYPEGIQWKENLFSKDMIKRMSAEYSDIDEFNSKLDDYCSTIFAAAFWFSISMTGFTTLIITILLIGYALSQILPFGAQQISIVFAALLMTLIILNSILAAKIIRDKPGVGRFHFQLMKILGFMMHINFAKPMNYIVLTLRTNVESTTKATIMSVLAMFIILAISLPPLLNTNLTLFFDDRFVIDRNQQNVIYDDAYLDQRVPGSRIIFPSIPSFNINGNALQIFIPKLNRENDAIEKLTPKLLLNEELTREQRRVARTKHYLDGVNRYFSLLINNKNLEDISMYQYTHPNAGEKGVLIVVPAENFNIGENLLEIQRAYQDEDGNKSRVFIPFMFFK